MREFEIAFANKRTDKYWKNKQMTFDAFKEFLRTPVITAETLGVYTNLSKSEQDKLKDQGCYLAGYIKDGHRSKENVIRRSIIALDVDNGAKDFVNLVKANFKNDFLLHSTRKHTEDKPRYRFIVPLSRNVTPDEYEFIARCIANLIGIEQFDPTTYQASRLMYRPSVSKGQSYHFEYNYDRGNELFYDVDKLLKSITNWADRSTWPTSDNEGVVINNKVKKQADPLDKEGVIGAFCRTYSIQETIEIFLSDKYEKVNDNRYTYLDGSSTGGAVIYEDKFLYSNHATDPCSLKLCNSFDLVRIHNFESLDENAKDNTPISKLPSYQAMRSLAMSDQRTKEVLGKEEYLKAFNDFESLDYTDEKEKITRDELDWVASLTRSESGKIEPTIENICLILRNDPQIKGKIRYNSLAERIETTGTLYWDKEKKVRFWTDVDEADLRRHIENIYRIKSRNAVDDGFTSVVYKNTYHPIQDYVKAITWDGIKRAENIFIDYLGASGSEYVRAVTKLTLVGAIKRIFEPGAKFDTAIVLIGGQGIGKTEIVKRLGGKWFNNSLFSFKGKEAYEQLQGSWIIELGELEALKYNEVETIKHFMSKTEDTYRRAYGRNMTTTKRQCVFIGTSNTYDFLKDPTGDRRWYPIDVGKFEPKYNLFTRFTEDEVAQVWAEAYSLYTLGELSYLKDKNTILAAQEEQKAHREESPYQGIVDNYINMKVPSNWGQMSIIDRKKHRFSDDPLKAENTSLLQKVCVLEIWTEAFDGMKKDLDRAKSNEIKKCILKNGEWEQSNKSLRFGKEYGVGRGFERKN